MKIEVCKRKHRCGFGVCRQPAEFGIKPDRVGIRGAVYICRECLNGIYEQAGAILVPKSPQNLFERKRVKPTVAALNQSAQEAVKDVGGDLGGKVNKGAKAAESKGRA